MNSKLIKKIMASVVLGVTFLTISPIAAHAEWKQDSVEWWYAEGDSYAKGWQYINGNWYYFYSDGYMARNQFIGSYYLGADGAWTNNIPSWVKSTGVISDNSEMVYASINGTKYHRTPNCNGDATRELTLNEAKKRGYVPDSKCWGLSGN